MKDYKKQVSTHFRLYYMTIYTLINNLKKEEV